MTLFTRRSTASPMMMTSSPCGPRSSARRVRGRRILLRESAPSQCSTGVSKSEQRGTTLSPVLPEPLPLSPRASESAKKAILGRFSSLFYLRGTVG